MTGAGVTGAGASVTGSSAVEAAADIWGPSFGSSNQFATSWDRNRSSMASTDRDVDCGWAKEKPQYCVLSLPSDQPAKPSAPSGLVLTRTLFGGSL